MKALKWVWMATLLLSLVFAQVGFAETDEPQSDGQESSNTSEKVVVSGISLDKSQLELKLGETSYLTATISPDEADNKAITWNSSNEEIVEVLPSEDSDDLTVSLKAVGTGSAAVTVTTADGSYTAVCLVTVTQEQTKELDELKISSKNVTLLAGESKSVKLVAEYEDGSEADVTTEAEWTSIPKAVAEVEAGTITGKSNGKAWVLASYGGEIVKVEVRVVNERELAKLEAKPNDVKLTVGESKEIALKATYKDGSSEDVALKAEWISAPSSVIEVNQGKVTGLAVGEGVVIASYQGETEIIRIKVTSNKEFHKLEFRDEKGKRQSKVELKSGETATLKLYAVYKDKSVKEITEGVEWKVSGRKSVIELDNGTITAKESGTVPVRATYNGKSATIVVKVKTNK